MRELIPVSAGFGNLRNAMERVFDRFFEDGGELTLPMAWAPRVDVSETKERVTVQAELPGLDAKDLEVSLQDQTLTIKGEKKHEKEEKDEHYYRMERAYGAFARSLRLPSPVDSKKVDASFKNGVLVVTMPKTAEAKAASITVKAA